MAAVLVAIPLLGLLLFMVSAAMNQSTDSWLEPQYGSESTLSFILHAGQNVVAQAFAKTLNAVTKALNDVVGNHTASFVNFIAGHAWSWDTYLSAMTSYAADVRDALDHAFTVAIPDAFRDAKAYVDTSVLGVSADLAQFEADTLDGYKTVAREISHYVDLGVTSAEGYADAAASQAYSWGVAYTDAAVAALRDAESAAVKDAVRIANDARAAIAPAVAAGVSEAEQAAAGALAFADTAAKSALDAVRSVAVAAENDVTALDNYIAGLGLGDLVKAVPGIATLVTAIAVEAGLENASCRGKVKQICQTDASAWTALLGGLAAVGLAFNLRELYAVAEPLVASLAPVIREAA